MIQHTEFFSQWREVQAAVARDLKGIPDPPDRRLYSYSLPSFPDLVLMIGWRVPAHDDGYPAWQPLLILSNPGWWIRGPRQVIYRLDPQSPGTLMILDIGQAHLVSTGGKNHREPWVALCWNPNRCPPAKAGMTLSEAVAGAKDAFKRLLLGVLP